MTEGLCVSLVLFWLRDLVAYGCNPEFITFTPVTCSVFSLVLSREIMLLCKFERHYHVHFKTIYDIYPCKELLRARFNLDDNTCTFCEEHSECQEHLFYTCKNINGYSQRILYQFVNIILLSLFFLCQRTVKLCVIIF